MSGAAARGFEAPSSTCRRDAFAHLLHALNQPLTGLQCSLELAVAQPHSAGEYARTLREGLELVGRMRTLMEALRAIAEMQPWQKEHASDFLLDDLLLSVAHELQPVAETKGVHFTVLERVLLPVRADRKRVQTVIFQLLDSVLSLAKEDTSLQITASRSFGDASVKIAWLQGTAPAGSPFSREELELFIAQHGWEAVGGAWTQSRMQDLHTCSFEMPLAGPVPDCSVAGGSE